ncbi:MAG: NAD(P)H-dependent oxidoreductase subunit E [Planctomycetes bacterium]|nr:NAD(P)H-dependent oxidoreductase subunit E [Planctomycetota bacterium]
MRSRDTILGALQDLHEEHGYLPAAEVKRAAERLGVPLSQAYSVATFYRAFSLKPRGKRVVRVCLGTACHVRGAREVVEALERALEIKAGETTPDRAVTLEVVKCVGACAIAPVAVVGKTIFAGVSPENVSEVLR